MLNFESIVAIVDDNCNYSLTRNSESRNKAVKMALNYVILGQGTEVRVHHQMETEIF